MASKQFEYVTLEEVLAIHESVIHRYGGEARVRDACALQSCLVQPQMFAFGHELYASLAEKAAAYWFLISQNQPFTDGNKRTGFLTAIRFLHMNTSITEIDNDLAYGTILAVIDGRADRDALVKLFESAIVR